MYDVFFQEPRVAFEDVDATELYPCVMFYSSNPGEKVSIKRQHFGLFYCCNITICTIGLSLMFLSKFRSTTVRLCISWCILDWFACFVWVGPHILQVHDIAFLQSPKT